MIHVNSIKSKIASYGVYFDGYMTHVVNSMREKPKARKEDYLQRASQRHRPKAVEKKRLYNHVDTYYMFSAA